MPFRMLWHTDSIDEAVECMRSVKLAGEKPAIVLDIDETVLTFRDGPLFPVHGMKELIDSWIDAGAAIFGCTARTESARAFTTLQLKVVGVRMNEIFFMDDGESNVTMGNVSQYKNDVRASLKERGYTICACVGDQWSDVMLCPPQFGAAAELHDLHVMMKGAPDNHTFMGFKKSNDLCVYVKFFTD